MNKFKKNTSSFRSTCVYQHLWAINTLSAHRKRGINFTFSVKDLKDRALKTAECEYCHSTLSWTRGRKKPGKFSATLDNINCHKTLGLSDIAIICLLCNTSKGRRTLEEFITYCSSISKMSLNTLEQVS